MEIPNIEVVTESGSTYIIREGFCVKTNSEGMKVDAFKLWKIKACPEDVSTFEEIYGLEHGMPEVGKRMFISGKDSWWLSTQVKSINEIPES